MGEEEAQEKLPVARFCPARGRRRAPQSQQGEGELPTVLSDFPPLALSHHYTCPKKSIKIFTLVHQSFISLVVSEVLSAPPFPFSNVKTFTRFPI